MCMQAEPPVPLPSLKALLRRVGQENQVRPKPFLVCASCRLPIHPDEGAHWLFPRYCDGCGLSRLDRLARRAARAGGRRRFLRALKRRFK
jgi:hypothetical protein